VEKYGVEFDKNKVKTAEERGKDNTQSCPECDKKLDSGGACPDHGTEPLEKREE